MPEIIPMDQVEIAKWSKYTAETGSPSLLEIFGTEIPRDTCCIIAKEIPTLSGTVQDHIC